MQPSTKSSAAADDPVARPLPDPSAAATPDGDVDLSLPVVSARYPGRWVAAAAILIFIFSLGFYVTPTLLGAGKTVMVAEYINVQVSQTLRWGIATALATMLLVTVGLLVWLLGRVADLDRLFGAAKA